MATYYTPKIGDKVVEALDGHILLQNTGGGTVSVRTANGKNLDMRETALLVEDVPLTANCAVSKNYVDAAVASAHANSLDNVRVAIDTNVNIAAGIPSTTDFAGVIPADGERVLLFQQTNPDENGTYDVVYAVDNLTYNFNVSADAIDVGTIVYAEAGNKYPATLFISESDTIPYNFHPYDQASTNGVNEHFVKNNGVPHLTWRQEPGKTTLYEAASAGLWLLQHVESDGTTTIKASSTNLHLGEVATQTDVLHNHGRLQVEGNGGTLNIDPLNNDMLIYPSAGATGVQLASPNGGRIVSVTDTDINIEDLKVARNGATVYMNSDSGVDISIGAHGIGPVIFQGYTTQFHGTIDCRGSLMQCNATGGAVVASRSIDNSTSTFRCLNSVGANVAQMVLDHAASTLTVETVAANASIHLKPHGTGSVIVHNALLPAIDGDGAGAGVSFGNATYRWRQLFSENATVSTSDARTKRDVESIEDALQFVNSLRPVTYRWNGEGRDRLHAGMIAQEVRETLDSDDYGMWVKDQEGEEGLEGLRYAEFIPYCLRAIQQLSAKVQSIPDYAKRIKSLQRTLEDTHQRIDELEELLLSTVLPKLNEVASRKKSKR